MVTYSMLGSVCSWPTSNIAPSPGIQCCCGVQGSLMSLYTSCQVTQELVKEHTFGKKPLILSVNLTILTRQRVSHMLLSVKNVFESSF